MLAETVAQKPCSRSENPFLSGIYFFFESAPNCFNEPRSIQIMVRTPNFIGDHFCSSLHLRGEPAREKSF